jgi:hypothetical protein
MGSKRQQVVDCRWLGAVIEHMLIRALIKSDSESGTLSLFIIAGFRTERARSVRGRTGTLPESSARSRSLLHAVARFF